MLSLSQPLVLTLDGALLIFQAFMNRRENHTCRFVLKWSVKFNVCWTVFFRSMNKTKQPAKETPALLILAMKRKNLSLQGFCCLILWSSEQGLGIKGGKKFFSCQSKEPMSIYNGGVFHVFLYGKTTKIVIFFLP